MFLPDIYPFKKALNAETIHEQVRDKVQYDKGCYIEKN